MKLYILENIKFVVQKFLIFLCILFQISVTQFEEETGTELENLLRHNKTYMIVAGIVMVFNIVFGAIGLILGFCAINDFKKGKRSEGKYKSLTGLVFSVLGIFVTLGILCFFYVFYFYYDY